MAERSSALDSSSGVVRMWVRILAGRGTCVLEHPAGWICARYKSSVLLLLLLLSC